MLGAEEASEDSWRYEIEVASVFFRMPTQAPNTLTALSQAASRLTAQHLKSSAHLAVVGDAVCLGFPEAAAWNAIRYVSNSWECPSPAIGVEQAIRTSKLEYFALLLDGARIPTSGILSAAANIHRAHPDAVVAVRSFHLGDTSHGSVQEESRQFQIEHAAIDQSATAYDLFKECVTAPGDRNGWFGPLMESTFLVAPTAMWRRIPNILKFQSVGGGLLGHYLLRALVNSEPDRLWVALGEATFHQFHGGASTRPLPSAQRRRLARQWDRELSAAGGIRRQQLVPANFIGQVTKFRETAVHNRHGLFASDSIIKLGNASISYTDGSESSLLRHFASGSKSSQGASKTDQPRDWATDYHTSPVRGNIIRPMGDVRGLRVLDVGGGHGAIAEALLLEGAKVTLVEGSLARCRVAAARLVRFSDQIDIVCGNISDIETKFDRVLSIGVLEWVASTKGNRQVSQQEFLHECADRLTENGEFWIAIENQLGAKYWLGHPEDHAQGYFSSIAGYPRFGRSGVRTFTKKALAEMLLNAGLAQQEWFLPFPDYKMPRTIIAEKALEALTGIEWDHLIRHPSRSSKPQLHAHNERRILREVLDAGLGSELSNSFLVRASKGQERCGATPTELAWIFSQKRHDSFMTSRRLVRSGDSLVIAARPKTSSSDWLTQEIVESTDWVRGVSLEQVIHDAALRDGPTGFFAGFQAFIEVLRSHSFVPSEGQRKVHPYSPIDGERALESRFLDVSPDNWIRTIDGTAVYVDTEWRSSDVNSFELLSVRSAFYLTLHSKRDLGGVNWLRRQRTVRILYKLLPGYSKYALLRLLVRFVVAESEMHCLVTRGELELGSLRRRRFELLLLLVSRSGASSSYAAARRSAMLRAAVLRLGARFDERFPRASARLRLRQIGRRLL